MITQNKHVWTNFSTHQHWLSLIYDDVETAGLGNLSPLLTVKFNFIMSKEMACSSAYSVWEFMSQGPCKTNKERATGSRCTTCPEKERQTGEWISQRRIRNHQKDPTLRPGNVKHSVTAVAGGDRLQLKVTDLEGQPVTLSLTWLCSPSGIRADGVGASGSHGWLPAL